MSLNGARKLVLQVLIAVIIALLGIFLNTYLQEPHQMDPNPIFMDKVIAADESYYRHLSKMIQFETVSWEDQDQIDLSQVTAFYKYIETSFPKFWTTVERTPVGNYSMVFKWKTADSNSKRLPILLMSHLDVVPAITGNWTYPPFSGHITDTEIWGRGAIDDKQMLLGTLASMTRLMEDGFRPNRDVYVSFGFDEEIAGWKGACAVSDYLRSKNLKFEFIHDEGMPILDGIMPGLTQPVAPVGLAEKGSLDLEISLTGSAGHSSIPPPQTIIGILAQAITALEANPIPAQLEGIARKLVEGIAANMVYPLRLFVTNLFLFKPLLLHQFTLSPETNAIVRTTTATTIIRGGVKSNVLPDTASVHLNFRISPMDSVKSVLDHVTRIFLNVDPRFNITVVDSLEPAPISDPESPTFKAFSTAIRTAFPNVLVTPGIMVGNTDTRHMWGLSDNIYRFAPNILNQEGVNTFHGVNERISKKNLMHVINFYYQLLLQFGSN